MTTKVTVTFSREEMEDTEGDTSWLTQDYAEVADSAERERYKAQDAKRLAAYNRGEWHFIGIRATALIRVGHDNGASRYTSYYEMASPGLYRIESDSSAEYLAQVYADECAQLRADIEAMKYAEFKPT